MEGSTDPYGTNLKTPGPGPGGTASPGGASGGSVLHAGIDMVAVPSYAVYYGSHELARGSNSVGEEFGLPGEAISHLGALSLVERQALGLAGDAAVDAPKNQALWPRAGLR